MKAARCPQCKEKAGLAGESGSYGVRTHWFYMCANCGWAGQEKRKLKRARRTFKAGLGMFKQS